MARPQTISDEQILETARGCFLERGPLVSTEVIAGELGVSPQALYKRFHSKQQLMLAALRPEHPAPWISLVERGPDNGPLDEQLRQILEEIAGFFFEMSRRFSVLRWSGISPQDIFREFEEPPPLLDIRVLSNWFERAQMRGMIRDVDNRATAMLVLTSLHGPAMLTDMLGKHPTGHTQAEYVDILVNLLIEGLRP